MIYEILTLIGWPIFIYVSYKLCVWAVFKYEEKEATQEK